MRSRARDSLELLYTEGQQEHLWPSLQNLINLSRAPTDPDGGDLCTYKHLCLQFFASVAEQIFQTPLFFFHLLKHIMSSGGADCLALTVFLGPIPFS